MFRIHLRRALPAVALSVTVALLAAMPTTPGVVRVSGKFTVKYSQQHQLPAADAAGPVLLANEARGTNSSTGQTDYMNGATTTLVEIADLTQGNGSHQGYVTFTKGADKSLNRWNGRITTTLSANNQPSTSFEGTWTKLSGTGRYEGVSGNGRYKGRMLSPTEFVVEWDGELTLKDKKATP
jgi:hypothetical protein